MTSYCDISWQEQLSPTWDEVREHFLSLIRPHQRGQVAALLSQSDACGRGLRTWLRLIGAQGELPSAPFSAELVQVYLTDDEAMPLHDCSGCGVAIPVRPDWQGLDGEPQEIYFPQCPCCGERTGLYAAWSRSQASSTEAAVAL